MDLPQSLIDSLQGVKGFDKGAFLEVHQSGKNITSVRINPDKLIEADIPFPVKSKVPWSSSGYYLHSRPVFTLDPLFHAGAYYVQEASSMFLEQAIRQLCDLSANLIALDLCAAPGGKSTLIQSLISPESVLVSNEINKSRVGILEENIVKWGAANVVITNSSPEQFSRLPKLFDLVVVDAPCSGSGLFRKDPDAINEWSLQNVEMCARRQKTILERSLSSLADGGVLIYSTCSYSKKEDEDIAKWCNDAGLSCLRIDIDPSWNIVEVEIGSGVYGYRFYPDKLDGEGFFLAAFRKPGLTNPGSRFPSARKKNAKFGKAEMAAEKWIDKGNGKVEIWQDHVLLMPEAMHQLLPFLQMALYIKNAGLRLGAMVREDLVPDHALALSGIVSREISRIELDLDEALRYLRREEIHLRSASLGWHLVTYKNVSLGWMKSLGSRFNNYYPKEWRIRMKS